MSIKRIRILIADDHPLIREGLKTILTFEEDITVVGEAMNGAETIANIKTLVPDVVLLDVNMPDQSGIEVMKEIKASNLACKFIMITADDDRKTVFEAIEAGADGYILKDSESVDLIQAVQEVYSGESYIDRRIVSYLVDKFTLKDEQESHLDGLTDREIEVLKRIAKGYTNKQIAMQLFLSEKTIKNYATAIYRKLEVRDRVQATLYAIRHDIDDR